MKKTLLVFAVALTVLIGSCSKDDDSNTTISTALVNTTISSGTWRVTYFWDTDHDETNHFTGYNFTFSSGGVLTAVSGANTSSGTWATGTDNSKIKLVILFTTPADFSDLSEDWEVTERTDSRIKLQHISGGNGGTDFLTFEKN